MSISILESRLKENIPEEYHKDIEKEIGVFLSEISRLSCREEDIGQSTLTHREIERAPTTNQHGKQGFTVIELQCIKAAAIKYGIDDWLMEMDSSLSYEENVNLMESKGSERSMRELAEIR